MSANGPFVFLPAVQYHGLLSGRTRHLADALASLGHDVVFVDFPSPRAALQRCLSVPAPRGPAHLRVLQLAPLPGRLLTRRLAVRAWTRYACHRLTRRIARLGEATVVVSTPWWLPVVRSLPRRILCYDCIDHVSVHSGPHREELFAQWERDLLCAANIVTTVSEALRRTAVEAGAPPARTFNLPNAVAEEWTRTTTPDATGLSPAVAGFLGSLYQWVDLDLLAAAARALPEVRFRIAGPVGRGISLDRLRALPNIRLAGAVPARKASDVIASFNLALIPFKRSVVSELCDPLKLYEYLALGKPVVTTVPPARPDDPAPAVFAEDTESFIAGIADELRRDNPRRRRERIAYAARHTWRHRALEMLDALARIACQEPASRKDPIACQYRETTPD